MQVTRPNEIRRPGVRLHPKAFAALGLEAERATPKHLGTLSAGPSSRSARTRGPSSPGGVRFSFFPQDAAVQGLLLSTPEIVVQGAGGIP